VARAKIDPAAVGHVVLAACHGEARDMYSRASRRSRPACRSARLPDGQPLCESGLRRRSSLPPTILLGDNRVVIGAVPRA